MVARKNVRGMFANRALTSMRNADMVARNAVKRVKLKLKRCR